MAIMQESDQEVICSLALDFYGETRHLIDEGIEPSSIMSALASLLLHMSEVHEIAAQDADDLIQDAVMVSRARARYSG
jgi:hypothetical protein